MVNPVIPEDPLPILDSMGALKRLGGRKMVYDEILQQFEPEFRNLPNEVLQYTTAGQWASAERMVHSLKGASAAIGAMALSATAATLERMMGDSSTDIQHAIDKLERQLKQTFEAIGRYFERESDDVPVTLVGPAQARAKETNKDDVMRRLIEYLESGDMQAAGAWGLLKGHFSDPNAQELVAEFDRQLDRLDFMGALNTLKFLVDDKSFDV